MHSLLRFTLLAACAAAGVGLAVSLALHMEPGDAESAGDQAARLFNSAKQREVFEPQPQDQPPNHLALALPAVPPPTVAPVQPPVSQDASGLEKAIAELKQATERNSDAFVNALQNLQQNGLPPNTVTQAAPPPQPLPQPAPAIGPPPEPAPRSVAPEEIAPRAITQVARGEGDDQLQINVQTFAMCWK